MLTADEVSRPGDVPLWEVPGWRERYGIIAGITGRGSDPIKPFDLGLWTAQPVGEVMQRWRDFRNALPEFPAAVLSQQVHSNTVNWHGPLPAGWTIQEAADGHGTLSTGNLLLITVADCVPIYLAAPRQQAVVLLHSGWRGTACGILSKGLDLLKTHASAHSHEVVMHCGIAISGKEYEVGNEVFAAVDKPHPVSGRSHLDLRELLVEQGQRLGIGAITSSSWCSSSRRDLFFSHRGSGGTDGRMVAYLGLPKLEG